MANKYIIYSVHNMFFKMIKRYYFDLINNISQIYFKIIEYPFKNNCVKLVNK